ncbi:MAG: PilZ domain-containing protein [Candidatus Firestonebacteria bacterium]|mgnify:CR=1 FL=1
MFSKRKFLRVNILANIVIHDILNDKYLQGAITNISAGGLAILINEPIEVGTPLSVTFEVEGYKKLQKISGDVVRVEKLTDKYYHGIAFYNLPKAQEEELESYINSLYSKQQRAVKRGRL